MVAHSTEAVARQWQRIALYKLGPQQAVEMRGGDAPFELVLRWALGREQTRSVDHVVPSVEAAMHLCASSEN